MSILSHFRNIAEADKSRAVEKLIKESTPDFGFFLFMTLSFFVVTFGLLIGSTAVIIGAMLIAPILYPILSFSQGVVMSDPKLMHRSFSTILTSMALGIGIAAVIALLFVAGSGNGVSNDVINARTVPSLLQFAIAVITGLAVCYALVKGDSSESLPGVAVSVTLLPPLAVIGIGIGVFNWDMVIGALMVFTINTVGVFFSGLLTFSIMDFYSKRQIADNALKKEVERVEEEEKKAEQMEKEEKIKEKETQKPEEFADEEAEEKEQEEKED